MAVIAFPARNKLAYPAGRLPGFDPLHPMSNGLNPGTGMSAIPVGKNHISLLSGVRFTQTGGSQTAAIYGATGPSVNYTSTDTNTIASLNAVTPTVVTFAVIFTPTDVSVTSLLICDNVNATIFLYYNGTEVSLYMNGSNTSGSGLSLVNNVPYFIALSANATTANIVVRNLASGAVRSASVASVAFTPFSGTVGISYPNANGAKGAIACAAAHFKLLLSLPQLQQWADDPWGFWYPPQARSRVAAAAATFLAGWASQTNLPVLGTGTY